MRTHSQFLFSTENEVNRRCQGIITLRGRRESWWSIIHPACWEFIYFGNIRDFCCCCDKEIGYYNRVYPAAGSKKKEEEKNESSSETSRRVSHLAGKLPRCSTKSWRNLGDYAAHRSSRVQSSWISCLGAFQPSDGSFRNYRDFGVSPKIGRGPRIRPVHVASILSSFACPISLYPENLPLFRSIPRMRDKSLQIMYFN